MGRLALFPKYLEESSEVFDEEQLFQFARIKDVSGKPTKAKGWSLASEVLAKGVEQVHAYGQRSANTQNQAYIARHGVDPDPESMYLGYFRLDAAALNSFEFEHHTMEIRWVPEHGEVCHFQLEITPIPDTQRVLRNAERRQLVKSVCESVTNFLRFQPQPPDAVRDALTDELLDAFQDGFGVFQAA